MPRFIFRFLTDIRPLRTSPDFRRLWVGQTLSGIGSQMARVTVAVQIYDISHSSFAVGLAGIFAVVPALLFSLMGGVLIDSCDRKKIILFTSCILTLVALTFAYQAWAGTGSVALLYLLTSLQSALMAIDGPARRSVIARLLPSDQIPAASSLLQLSFQVSLLTGPVVGGIIIARAGFSVAYLIDALSFILSLYAVLRMNAMPVENPVVRPGLSSLTAGARFICQDPVLSAVLLTDIFAMVLAMPRAIIPAITEQQFSGGPELAGLFFAAPAVGGLAAAIFSGPLSSVRRQGLATLFCALLWGLSSVALAVAHDSYTALIFLAIGGAADMIGGVFRATLVQTRTPDNMRGRVNSLASLISTGGPSLGDFRAGLTASLLSPAASALAGGVACIACTSILALKLPSVIRFKTSESDLKG